MPHPSRRPHLLPLVTLLLGAAACGPLHRGGAPAAAPSAAFVVFDNESTDQADVYAVPIAGDDIRVGTVEAGQTAHLRLPSTAIGADGMVNIVARVFASPRAPRTGRVPISTGQGLQVTLPPEENMLAVLPVERP